jgi:hypothetical protein
MSLPFSTLNYILALKIKSIESVDGLHLFSGFGYACELSRAVLVELVGVRVFKVKSNTFHFINKAIASIQD